MKRYVAAHLGLLIVLVASTAYGQALPHNKNLEPMLPFIGKWTADVTLPEDIDGVGKQGDHANLLVTYQWTRNKQAITAAIDWNVQGEIKSINTGLIAWDPMNKKIIGLTAHADGGITHYEYQSQGDKLVIPGRGANADGVRTVTTFEFSDVSKDSFTVRIIKRVAGDEDTTPPPGPGLKVTRV